MVELVISASGILAVEDVEGLSGKQLLEKAVLASGVSLDRVSDPFIVRHNSLTNTYSVIPMDEPIKNIKEDAEVIRVVLPLQPKV